MTKKKEALNKAKESGKKIVEGGKEILTGAAETVGYTTGALGCVLLSAGEKGVSKINEHREKEEGISVSKRKKLRDKANSQAEKAAGHIKKAGKFGKKAISGAGKAIKGGAETVGYTLKTSYHLIDAGDKAIGEKIEKKQLEKGKKSGRIGRFIRNNTAKLLITLGATGYGGYEGGKYVMENNQHKEEVLANTKNDVIINPEDDKITILESEEETTKNDPMQKKEKVKIDEIYKDQGVTLLRDNNLVFYVVKKGDSLIGIKNKLQKIPEFSYLASKEYEIPESGRNIQSFNTPASSLTPGFYLPIPLKVEDREISENDFKKAAKNALDEMQANTVYGDKTKELLENVKEKDIINIMTAYARCETAPDYKNFSDNIGNVELHRREPSCGAYSFSYFHILMGEGPGLNARLKLGLTEGDCYDAKNACKLFLGYCFEKKKGDPTYFFKVQNLGDAKKVGKTYNGSSKYGDKFWANIQHVKGNDTYV